MQIDLQNQNAFSLSEFKELKRNPTKDITVTNMKSSKLKRASTTIINPNFRQIRKESLNFIDVNQSNLPNQSIMPSIPNAYTENSVKGNYNYNINNNNNNTLNFTQTILIQPDNNQSGYHFKNQSKILQNEEENGEIIFQRKARSQSLKQYQTMLTNDSDEYFKEDRDLGDSTQKSSAREQQEMMDVINQLQKNNGVIVEQPPENETSPLKKKKATKSVTVSDKELRDPPRDIIFRWNQFFQIFVYHVIYYMFGSVLGLFLLYLIQRGKNIRLLRNLGFYGLQSIQVWEMIFSNLFFSMNVLCVYYFNELSRIYIAESAQLLIVLLQRAFIVSVKYGNLHFYFSSTFTASNYLSYLFSSILKQYLLQFIILIKNALDSFPYTISFILIILIAFINWLQHLRQQNEINNI